jgi:hypothetical protein
MPVHWYVAGCNRISGLATFLAHVDEMVKEKSLAKRKTLRENIVSSFSAQMEAIDAALQETLGLPVLGSSTGRNGF